MEGAILAVPYQKVHQYNGSRLEFVWVGGGPVLLKQYFQYAWFFFLLFTFQEKEVCAPRPQFSTASNATAYNVMVMSARLRPSDSLSVGPQVFHIFQEHALCNRSFWWRFCVVTLLIGFFCQCRGFCHRTESDLFHFLLEYLAEIWRMTLFMNFKTRMGLS